MDRIGPGLRRLLLLLLLLGVLEHLLRGVAFTVLLWVLLKCWALWVLQRT